MPKRPILTRDKFFSRQSYTAGGGANALQLLKEMDWNVVLTDLGPMVEPNQSLMPDGTGSATAAQVDFTDSAYTAVHVLDNEASFANDFGTGGSGIFYDFGV